MLTNRRTGDAGGLGCMALIVLLWLCGVALVAFVVFHFIAKHW